MIADDAVVLETDWQVAGRDSIMAKWITQSLPVISNLKTEKITDCVCCCCVSLTAFYSLDFTTKEGVVTEKGNFTFIWNQAEDKTWKLTLIHMDVFENKK
jgi:ketosteroid isomerase-like protein